MPQVLNSPEAGVREGARRHELAAATLLTAVSRSVVSPPAVLVSLLCALLGGSFDGGAD